VPIEIPFFSSKRIKVSLIQCGSQHNMAVSSQGKVYSWGCNDDGALGRTTLPENVP
jgi:regulator of chromosome condensation